MYFTESVTTCSGGFARTATNNFALVVEDSDGSAGGVRDVARHDVVTGERHVRRPAHAVAMLQHFEILCEV